MYSFRLGFPKIKRYNQKIGNILFKYQIGRDNVGWWSLAENWIQPIRVWFKYL
jgi:hypothetical protein